MDTSTLKEIEEMQLFLESDPPTEPQAMSIRLSELSVRMARSSYLLAMAKYEQDLALIKASRLKDLIPLAPSVQKEILKSACAEENKIVNWLDRINRTCVHQSDNLRTQLSFEKEQIRQMGCNT